MLSSLGRGLMRVCYQPVVQNRKPARTSFFSHSLFPQLSITFSCAISIEAKHIVTMPEVPFVEFNNGQKFPIFGLGTWKSKAGDVAQAVRDAIDVGYRHIDCAHVYGNESEVGRGIRDKIKEGVVKREDLYITSKLWNTMHRKDLVEPAIHTTLKNLGLKHLDLYLIHWPQGYKEGKDLFPEKDGKTLYSDVDYIETWHAMEELVKKKLTTSIGVSNFNHEQIDRILAVAKIKPVTNQIEVHPYLSQSKMIEYCKSKGLTVTAYSPLGSPDRPWAKPGDPLLMDDPKIKEIAARYKKSPAQVVLRYEVQRGLITIPKSVHKERIKENISIFDFELDTDDMKRIDSFDCGGRVCHLNWIKDHKYYPFNIDY